MAVCRRSSRWQPSTARRPNLGHIIRDVAVLKPVIRIEHQKPAQRRVGSVQDFVFSSQINHTGHLSTGQYAQLVDEWVMRYSLAIHTSFGGEYPDGLNTARQRQRARSQRMEDRLTALTQVKEISKLEADFVLAAHEHRNAAYHEGFGGGAHLRPLCIAYYRFACQYLVRFQMAFHTWVSNFAFTEISRRYYDAALEQDGPLGQINRVKLAAVLDAQIDTDTGLAIQDILADELEDERQSIVESFRFLIENIQPRLPTLHILTKVQFEHARDMALEKKGLERTHFDTPRRIEAVNFVKTTWKKYVPRYQAIPHGAWSQGIARIRSSHDPHLAVVQFQRLRAGMEFLRSAICGAAFDLEMELQSRYD